MTKALRNPNGPAVGFMVMGSVWLVIGTLYGMAAAIHLMAPEFFNNMPAMFYGRTRPLHINTLAFGFVVGTMLGVALYVVPALLRTRLWSPMLGWVSFFVWQVGVAGGGIGIALGYTQGREYAEYEWIIDVGVMLALVTIIVNLVMTLVARREKLLFVSVWYYFGAAVWTAMVYPIGNVMWHPATGALPGLVDSVLLWFYGHNVIGLLFTPLAVGTAYFVLPRVVKAPLFSHTLSLVGFWTLVAIYSHIGGHHILQTPIPNWLKTISVVDSIAMILPVFTVLANLWLTARGRMASLWSDPAGRFILMGSIWYLITCIQGPFHSLPSVQKYTHFTNWVVGHAHIAVMGFAGMTALGGLWHVLPLASGRKLYSKRLVHFQWGLLMFGLVGFFAVLTAAGLMQGSAWSVGEGVYRMLPTMAPMMVARAMLGVFILAAAMVGLHNVALTLKRGEPLETETVEPAEPNGEDTP
jgi:cytochrome c oxidase cbb3-type subunit I